MPRVFFKDAITGNRIGVDVPANQTLSTVLPEVTSQLRVQLPQEVYEFRYRGRRLDLDVKVKAVGLKNRSVVHLTPNEALRGAAEHGAEAIRSSKKIIVFVGSGASQDSDDARPSLSTRRIHYDFLEDLASSEPRLFERHRKEVNKLLAALERREGDEDMLSFMQIFEQLTQLRDRFVAYVVKLCCVAAPNRAHVALLDFMDIARGIGAQLLVFTTNYDNLLEKTRLEYRSWRVIPRYTLPTTRGGFMVRWRPSGIIPVVPLHGSIRLSRCPGCGRVLETHAASLGRALCAFCGAEVPHVVLPTAEGAAGKIALASFEEQLKSADVVLLVGYGLSDPHILERFERSLPTGSTIVNVSRGKLPQSLAEQIPLHHEVSVDVAAGISYLSYLLSPSQFEQHRWRRVMRRRMAREKMMRPPV